MAGAGFQPAGSTPAGYGAPLQASTSASATLPGASTVAVGSRYIDAKTRDYVLEEGRILGMNNVQHMVQLAVTNAAPDLQKLEKLDSSFERGVRAVLIAALAPLAASVDFLGVSVQIGRAAGLAPGQAVTTMRWRDRTTSVEYSETI